VPWAGIVGIFTSSGTSVFGPYTPLLHAICTMTVEWLVLYWMYKRKIFLTA
jgi:hypothetical protein